MKKWISILLVFGGLAWYLKPQSAYKPPPRILIVGDEYNFGGGQEKDFWGYRKPLQDLLGKDAYDFTGPNNFPNDDDGYDPDTYAEFYRRIGICKVNLKHSLPKLMQKAPEGSWIIIFMGAADITKQLVRPEFVAQDLLTMVKNIHKFNPEIGVIVARLPPPRTRMYDLRIVEFNRLVFEALQDLWYHQTEKKNLFIPDLYKILTSVPGWKRRVLGKTLYPTPPGWRIIAETFSDIIQGKRPFYYDYSVPEQK